MQWHSVNDFLAMGGYGFYVWGSFGVTFFLMGFELWLLDKRRKRVTQVLKQEAF